MIPLLTAIAIVALTIAVAETLGRWWQGWRWRDR